MVQLGGLEPPTSGSTDRRSNQLSYSCTGSRASGRKLEHDPEKWKPCRSRKSPGDWPGLTQRYWQNAQATFFIALLTPLLIGSAVSVATFCARPASSLPWPVSVSKCSRACLVDSSTNSDGDFTPNSASA